MELERLRATSPRNRFPAFPGSRGRSGKVAQKVATHLSKKWDILLTYVPGPNSEGKQGVFYVDATELTDLELEGVYRVIRKELAKYFRGNREKWSGLIT